MSRESECERKVRYETAGEAENQAGYARMLGRRTERPLRWYQCIYCHGFHLTSSAERRLDRIT